MEQIPYAKNKIKNCSIWNNYHAVARCLTWSTNLNQKALQVATSRHFNNYRLGIYNIISVYKYIHMHALITKSLN